MESCRTRCVTILAFYAGIDAPPSAELRKFYSVFPGQDRIADSVAILFLQAQGHSVSLDQSNYRLVESSVESPLARYEIALPVKGNYVAIRSFISQALQESPTLSLDAVSLSRGSANDSIGNLELPVILAAR